MTRLYTYLIATVLIAIVVISTGSCGESEKNRESDCIYDGTLAYLPEELAILREHADRGSLSAMYELRNQPYYACETEDWPRVGPESALYSEIEESFDPGIDILNQALEPGDYAIAHILFAVAASRLEGYQRDIAAYARDLVTDGLSPEDLSTVQRIAQECIEKGVGSVSFSGSHGGYREADEEYRSMYPGCWPRVMLKEALPALFNEKFSDVFRPLRFNPSGGSTSLQRDYGLR
jgi:hypothetical protein